VLLLARAKRIFKEVDSAQLEIADSQDLRTGVVRVGMPPMYGLRYFPPLMREFNKAFPGISVTAIQGSAGDVRTMLEGGAIDLAILESRRIDRSWAHVPLDKEELVLCVHREHRLASNARLADTDLDDLELILLDQRCAQASVSYRVVMQTNYVPLALQAAADGIGAVTLLRSMVTMNSELVGLSFDPAEHFQFNLCWNDEQYTSKANQAFIEFVGRYQRP
jgi:LysR family transcriptional regulator, cyn operon transcriptional activator